MKKLLSILLLFFTATAMAQNIGVGENTPTEARLQIKSLDSAVLLLHNPATAVNTKTALYFKNDNTYAGSVSTIQTSPLFYRLGFYTYGGSNPSALKERLTILDGGNVGIGTTNPGYLLDINGRARLMHNGYTSGIWLNKADNTEAVFAGMVNDSTYGFFGNAAVGNWRFGFDVKNAKMGIGIAAPTAPLSFASSVGNKIALWGDASGGHYGLGIQGSLMQLYSSASDADIALGYGSSTAFTENMRVKGNGNVGIGTNNPTAKLEVAGSLKIADGTQGAKKILTSDANGKASWANAAFGNTERFQFNIIRPSNSNESATFNTFYKFGSASGSAINLAPNGIDRTMTIGISKPGLYHFDWNVYSKYAAGNYTNNGRKKFIISICTSECTEVLKTYKSYDANDYLAFDRTYEIYISQPSTLYFETEASFSSTYDDFFMTVTGHLIAE